MTRVSKGSASALALAALRYAARGWPVLPLVPNQKIPLSGKSTAGFPEDGLLSASTDPAQILDWWGRVANANIGLRTGVAFDVLDFDSEAALMSLRTFVGDWISHDGPISTTGKGQHWLFAPTGHRNGAGLLEKLDFRGENGYIVAPPSIHPSGAVYRWDQPSTLTLPEAPAWLMRLLEEKQPPKSTYVVPEPVKVRRGGVWITDPAYLLAQEQRGTSEPILQVAAELGYRVSHSNKTRCPFGNHSDTNASLQLYPADDSFFCFGCRAVGFSSHLRSGKPIGG